MRIAVFGGTGRVGRRLIEYASQAGHSVRALARDPARLRSEAAESEAVAGDVSDPAAVLATLDGVEVVLSSLGGAGLANPGTAISQGMRNIVAAMTRSGTRRILAVAGSGVLDDPRGGLRGESPDFPELYRAITREHMATWEALHQSDLEWTLACCPDLVDGKRTHRYRVEANRLPQGGTSISVEDVADFMVEQAGAPSYPRLRVGLAY